MPSTLHEMPKENLLLAALPLADYSRLELALEKVSISAGDVIHDMGEAFEYLYFPVSCVVYLSSITQDGTHSEMVLVGNEGVVGISAVLGEARSSHLAVAQRAGHAYRIDIKKVRRELDQGGALLRVALLYLQSLLARIGQNAAASKTAARLTSGVPSAPGPASTRITPDDLRKTAEARRPLTSSSAAKQPAASLRLVHELEVHQIELEMQNEALATAYAEADAARERYAELYDFSPVAFMTVDARGAICQINLAGAILLGIKHAEFRQHRLGASVAPESLTVFNQFLDKVLREGCRETCEVTLSATKLRPAAIITMDAVPDDNGKECRMVVVDVTQERQHARQLREREQYQRALLDAFPFIAWLKDEQGRFLAVNAPFAAAFDWPSADSLVGKTDLDITTRELAESYRADDKAVLESGEPKIIEEWIETGDELRWYETFKTPVALDGRIIGTVGFARDLTEQKVMDAALRNSEADYRSLFELSVVGSAKADPLTGRLLRVNQKLCEITGYSADELLTLSFIDFTHPDDRERNWQGYRAVMTGETGLFVVDKRYVRKDGSLIWVNVQLTAVRDEHDLVTHSIAVIQDITLQRQAAAVLRDQLKMQNLLSKIVATVPGVICSFQMRPDGTVCMPYASAALREIYGLAPEAVRDDATRLLAVIHADDIARVNEAIAASADAMTPWRSEFRIHHTDKGIVWIDGHSMPQREADGSILWHGYLMDITARKRFDDALRESERNLRLAQAVAQTGSWHLDFRRGELRWSDETYRIFGIPNGTPPSYALFLSAVHPDDQASVNQAWRVALRGAPYEIEHRIVVAGETKWINERAELEFDPQGNLIGGFGSAQDITQRKRSEAALLASESRFRLAMEAIAGVVYEWDTVTGTTYWSSGLSRIFGVSGLDADEGRRWWRENVHPEDVIGIRHKIERIQKARSENSEMEYRMRHSAGYWMHISDRAHIVRDTAGSVVRLIGTLTDISARKHAEEKLHRFNDSLEELVVQRTAEVEARSRALLESERFARATIDALNAPVCVLDDTGHIITVNKAWRIFAEENGAQFEKVCEGADYLAVCEAASGASNSVATQVAAAIREIIAGRRQDFSIEYDCHSPVKRRWFALKLSCFAGDDPLRLVVKHEEITERKQAAEDLRESAKRLQRLAAHLETLREEQSAMIAREIHDELGGTLTMVKLNLAIVADGAAASTPLQDSLRGILDQVDAALQTVKRISADLRPATLDTLGLVAAIKWHVAKFADMTGIAVDLHLPEYIRLSNKRGTAIFRIIQEALTNIAKHAGASNACVAIKKHKGELGIEISDNGIGVTTSNRLKLDSFGLIGMHERALFLGGSLSITGTPNAGTRLSLHIPLDD